MGVIYSERDAGASESGKPRLKCVIGYLYEHMCGKYFGQKKEGQNCKHNVEKAMVSIDQKIQASVFIFGDTNN